MLQPTIQKINQIYIIRSFIPILTFLLILLNPEMYLEQSGCVIINDLNFKVVYLLSNCITRTIRSLYLLPDMIATATYINKRTSHICFTSLPVIIRYACLEKLKKCAEQTIKHVQIVYSRYLRFTIISKLY